MNNNTQLPTVSVCVLCRSFNAFDDHCQSIIDAAWSREHISIFRAFLGDLNFAVFDLAALCARRLLFMQFWPILDTLLVMPVES